MGRGMGVFLGVAFVLTSIAYFAGGAPIRFWFGFVGLFGVLFLIYIWSDRIRAHQWRLRMRRFDEWVFRSWLGRIFAERFGKPMARGELEKHILAERRERAVTLALRFDLVAHGADTVAEHRGPEAAADFARACGDEALAQRWLVRAYDGYAARKEWSLAAEAAESAGLYPQAMAAWHHVDGDGARVRAAHLSERTGHPLEALHGYLDGGAAGDALRVAQRFNLVPQLVAGAERREQPGLWRLAAEAAATLGDFRKAVDLYRRAGDLRLAHDMAKRGGLDEVERELAGHLAARDEAEAEQHRAGGFFGS